LTGNERKKSMKILNGNLWCLAAWSGVLLSRKNWVITLVLPAIPGQSKSFGVMLGTHKRYGLLLWDKWYCCGLGSA
jgi:hypothetical protein